MRDVRYRMTILAGRKKIGGGIVNFGTISESVDIIIWSIYVWLYSGPLAGLGEA